MYSISLQGLHCSLHLLLVLLLQNVWVWNTTPYSMSPCQWCGRDAETTAVKAEIENQASDDQSSFIGSSQSETLT